MIDVELEQYLNEKKLQDFQYGVCDCVLFTADWCKRITGKNPAKDLRGKYSDKAEAGIILRDKFNNEPEKFVDEFFERVEPNFAQKGDVALCDLDGKKTFGIVGARGFTFFKMSNAGIMISKKAERLIVWRIEEHIQVEKPIEVQELESCQ